MRASTSRGLIQAVYCCITSIIVWLHSAGQKVHVDTDPMLGEIYVVAVDPNDAGAGLGRALTVAGLSHLVQVGAQIGMLFVDAENTSGHF